MVPVGSIIIWSGAIVDIPSGWQLCNGTNGTPDLRNRFVVGAGDTYAVDANGGAVNHDHNFTGDGHVHNMPKGGESLDDSPATDFAEGNWNTDSGNATGVTDTESNLPPYYALAYIQRLT